jgi:hypothetical protein
MKMLAEGYMHEGNSMIRSNEIARHLRELGCSPQQIRRHLAGVTPPPAIVRTPPTPRSFDWLSWASRIRMNADNARRAAARRTATAPNII